jgi:RNA polymerase sigma factor (sigma-70 family)
MRSREQRSESAEEAALLLVQRHAAELLGFARRFSHCADDAQDAYQRTIEILVRRIRTDPPARLLPWVRTVLRHEALALRTEREQLVGRVEIDLDRHEDRLSDDPAERVVGHERLRHTAEALGRLKPQELTALVLRAEGLTYREICTRTGWTYTRTNRTVTEGRRALLERLGAIESGEECDRWLPLLSALADGEATASELAELRPHLRACPACRATLRDCHAVPAHVAALVPPALIAAGVGEPHGSLLDHAGLALHALAERSTLLAVRLQGALETLPGAKLAAVAASTAALAGGGVALEQATHARPVVRAAAATAPVGQRVRLVTIAFPSRSATANAAHRRAAPALRSEFASAHTGPSEFAAHADPAAEFAARPAPVPASAVVASAPRSVSSSPSPGSQSEFAGP